MATKRMGAYMRVSRIGGRKGEGYIAIPQQQERIGAHATFADYEIPDWAWFKDEDYSGGNVERPAFQEAVARIEAGELDGLVVVRIDRFSRSVMDGVEWVDRILKAGGEFASATEQLNFKEDIGHYMLVQFLNNAELQLRGIKRQWNDAKRKAVKRGVLVGATPFGYSRIARNVEVNASKLVPHEQETAAVLRTFQMRDDGKSYQDIARYLETVSPPRKGGAGWGHTTVARMLQNRVYLGEVSWGDITTTDAHEPLVPADLFDRVQGKLATKPKSEALRAFPLRGLVHCANCRYRMHGHSRQGKGARGRAAYRCNNIRCQNKAGVSVDLIEPYVIDAFWQAVADERGRRAGAVSADSADRLAELRGDLASAKDEIRDLSTNAERRRRLPKDTRQQMEDDLASQITTLESQVRTLIHETQMDDDELFTFERDQVDDAMLTRLLPKMVRYVFVRSSSAPVQDRVLVVGQRGPAYDVPRQGKPAGAFEPVSWPDDDGTALAAG